MSAPGLEQFVKDNIKALFLAGWSYKRIARHLKITKGQVAGVLFRAGLCQKKGIHSANNAEQDAPSTSGSPEARGLDTGTTQRHS